MGGRMDEMSANPLIVFLLFLLRCLVPLLFMLGLSYVLRRLGLIGESSQPPNEVAESEAKATEGDLQNG